MRRPFLSALSEALDLALVKPRAAAALTLVGLAGTLVATLISATAGAIVGAALFLGAVVLLAFALRTKALYEGPFVVLEETTTWDLTRDNAREAVVTKNQLVRFNHSMIAHTEYAWGDGELFADFQCDYGRLVDRVKDGDKEYIIIALPAERVRGEEARLVSHRTVRNGFPADSEWMNWELRYKSYRSTLVMRFDLARPPKNLRYRRESDGKTLKADEKSVSDEGGARVFRLSERAPYPGEEYQIRWDW
jgi:hypothetical protein